MSTKNGNLEAALTALIQSQATLTQTQAQFVGLLAETRQKMTDLEADIAKKFSAIEQILIKHHETLEALPEAIRQKIGFKAK